MEVKSIDVENFGNRGKWNQKAIIGFLKENHKPKTAIEVRLMDFYKQFYGGSKVIKYVGYYCRKHVLEALQDLKIRGIAEIDTGALKIRFDN